MKNGYDQFFKKARQNAAVGNTPGMAAPKKNPLPLHHTLSEKDIETHIRKKVGVRPSKKQSRPFPWKLVSMSFMGLLITSVGFVYHEEVEKALTMVEINLLGTANAQTAAPIERPPAAIDPAITALAAAQEEKVELDHLSNLRDKKKELDAREEEISRVEAELQKQQEELAQKIKELKDTREHISRMLEERVRGDEQKVETLVQMYSNMRPPQAAKIFENLDEDLAIDILGRMKKKSAADIMNLLKPEKAQVFSEKFAGYKRK
jgi:flagellar motility protein MotE (MotC chaperone)